MSSLDLRDVESYGDTEKAAVEAYAKKWGIRRMYKLANDYGDKVTHTNYYSVKAASDEIALLSSPYVHNVSLIYDRGEHISCPVTYNDADAGRQVLGIELLSD